jgi:tripartite-type tricarboxylate transporter receptor subunit TctC
MCSKPQPIEFFSGQSLFVENKAGATGTIGVQRVTKAEPDG